MLCSHFPYQKLYCLQHIIPYQHVRKKNPIADSILHFPLPSLRFSLWKGHCFCEVIRKSQHLQPEHCKYVRKTRLSSYLEELFPNVVNWCNLLIWHFLYFRSPLNSKLAILRTDAALLWMYLSTLELLDFACSTLAFLFVCLFFYTGHCCIGAKDG